MRTETSAILLSAFLASPAFAATPGPCTVQLSSQEPHSGLAQSTIASLARAVPTIPNLSVASGTGPGILNFLLVSASRNRTGQGSDSFRVFYVLTDSRNRLLGAETVMCSGRGDDCGGYLAKELGSECSRRMPDNSFKPELLRGSA